MNLNRVTLPQSVSLNTSTGIRNIRFGLAYQHSVLYLTLTDLTRSSVKDMIIYVVLESHFSDSFTQVLATMEKLEGRSELAIPVHSLFLQSHFLTT